MINSMARSLITAKKWYRNVSAGNPLYSDYELISTTYPTGVSTVTFDVTGLGSSYKHLQLRSVGRVTTATGQVGLRMRFNSDTGSNYGTHGLYGNGSSVGSFAGVSNTGFFAGLLAGNSIASNAFGAGSADILDAFSSSKNKTVRTAYGNSNTEVGVQSGFWNNTAAITSITVYLDTTGDFVTGSRLSLYGIKG